MPRNNQPPRRSNSTRTTKPLTGKEKVRKHIADINDQISDDDIKNVNTESYINYPSPDEDPNVVAKKERGGEGEGTAKTKTPWDIIE